MTPEHEQLVVELFNDAARFKEAGFERWDLLLQRAGHAITALNARAGQAEAERNALCTKTDELTLSRMQQYDRAEQAKAEVARLKDDYHGACKTVAAMHAAAVGAVQGAKRGVVEDVADLKSDRDRLRAALEDVLNQESKIGMYEIADDALRQTAGAKDWPQDMAQVPPGVRDQSLRRLESDKTAGAKESHAQ